MDYLQQDLSHTNVPYWRTHSDLARAVAVKKMFYSKAQKYC
jgi:hypothetical protein